MEGRAGRVVLRRQEAPQGGFVPLQAVEEGALARVHPVKSPPPSPVLPGPLFCPFPSWLVLSLGPSGRCPPPPPPPAPPGVACRHQWRNGRRGQKGERGRGMGRKEEESSLAAFLLSWTWCFGAPLLLCGCGCPRSRARRSWRPLIQCTTAQGKREADKRRGGEESTKRRRRRLLALAQPPQHRDSNRERGGDSTQHGGGCEGQKQGHDPPGGTHLRTASGPLLGESPAPPA